MIGHGVLRHPYCVQIRIRSNVKCLADCILYRTVLCCGLIGVPAPEFIAEIGSFGNHVTLAQNRYVASVLIRALRIHRRTSTFQIDIRVVGYF